MKQRLLVMNGQRLLQTELQGKWETTKVDKAMGIKPGIYDLHLARMADKIIAYDGVVLFTDTEHIFQLTGRVLTKHDRNQFELAPAAGVNVRITYGDGQARATGTAIKAGRGRSR